MKASKKFYKDLWVARDRVISVSHAVAFAAASEDGEQKSGVMIRLFSDDGELQLRMSNAETAQLIGDLGAKLASKLG